MRARWLVAAGFLGLSLTSEAFAEAQTCRPITSLDVVVKPNVAEDECHPMLAPQFRARFAAHSWQLFIALNWPAAQGTRGVPDGTDPKQIANRSAPRVWETWKSVQETFLPKGARPGEWDVAETHAICANSQELGPSPTKVLVDLNQSGLGGNAIGPLIAQNRTYVRYEIRMNRVGFEAIRERGLYLRDNLPAPNGDQSLVLPDGMINIKAAWREVRAGENTDRYYQTEALAFDPHTRRCDKRKFVLIGFHIVQKTPLRPQWIWATFEHVDNIKVDAGAPEGTRASLNDPGADQVLGDIPDLVDGARPLPQNPEAVQVIVLPGGGPRADVEVPVNTRWQTSKELDGTIWRFYKLIRTQWPTEPKRSELGSPHPDRNVANSTMETYLQQITCMGCHLKTSHRTDFTWFLSLRAYPIEPEGRSNAKLFSAPDAPPKPPVAPAGGR